jgi:hypothetical protein
MRIEVTADRLFVKIFWAERGPGTIGTQMDAHEVEDLILTLAKARSHLADEVPKQVEPGIRDENGLFDPTWRVQQYDHEGQHDKVISIRHPGYGWLRFAFPTAEAERMAAALSKVV